MNADRRIVPERHVASVLAEEHISERTIEIKNTLKRSPNKLHSVAHKWIEHNGMNPLARVMINNVHGVPQKKYHSPHVHNHSGHEAHHGHDAHGHGHEAHHGHDAHGHGHEAHHGHDAHGHGHEAHHGHDAHGHGHEAHHGHDAHGHGHEAHHGHDAHGHGHEEHSGFASFIHTGHWFGDHGAWIFGMIGRYLGEVLGYTLKLLAVLIVFGPTRTALIGAIIVVSLNIWIGTAFSVWMSAGACLIVHALFSLTTRMSGGGESGGGEHGGGHGGGHEDGHGHH